jgi:hypothetical protein
MNHSLPKVFRVRQHFNTERVENIPRAVAQALQTINPRLPLKGGERVAVGVGSRGIANLATIVKSVCRTLQEFGATPFVVPAMGSHGGATAEGQRHILESYGITEEAMGVPVKAAMETVELGRTPSGIRVFLDRHAAEADFILPVNRIKPHTDFRGENESGLVKMTAVGFGKYEGANEYHRAAFHLGYERVFQEVTRLILGAGRVLCGVAVLENALHETAKIAAAAAPNLIAADHALLEEARRMMPRLPCEQIDLLVIDEIGKNISGTGMDTNIIGRSVRGYLTGVPTHDNVPRITRILVCDLTLGSDGNAIGIGLADFTTARLMERLDLRATVINGLTALTPACAKLPVYFESDRQAIETGLKTAGLEDLATGRVVRIKNTLALAELEMSESYLDEVKARGDLTVLGETREMSFDARGNLQPFDASGA